MKKHSVCLTLLSSMLRISAFTFGGGFVIIPLMRRRFVETLHWITEEEMMDMMAIAQSSPGAVSLNIGAQLGWHMAGFPGAASAIAGTLLPPMFWLAIISACYDVFRASPVVDAFLRSMQPAVASVILYAGFSMLKALRHKEHISVRLLFGGALLLGFCGISVTWLLLAGAVIGAIAAVWEVKRHAE